MESVLDRLAEPVRGALRRENTAAEEGRPPRSRVRFCLDQCTAVTVACLLLLAASIYLLTRSEEMLTHVDALLQRLLQNITVTAA